MNTLHILLVICTGSAFSYDPQQRPNKIRFPIESTPLTQQIYTVGPPPQLFESESQAVPVVIKGINSVPFTVLQQVPITNIPQYADLGAKGFNDGLNFYQPFIRQDGEFHHTVPPPVRIPTYSLQKTVTHNKPKEQIHIQNIQYKPQRQQERVRISTQKYIAKPMKARPTITTVQQAPTHIQYNKEFKHTSQGPIYKYPIAMHQIPQNSQHSEYSENEYNEENYKRPILNKLRLREESKPVPQYSEEYADFHEKVPGWKLKGSVRDASYESNSNFHQKQNTHRPEAEDSKYYDEESEESFSYEEQPQEMPLNYNKYNKHHVPSQANYYRPKNELKKIREPVNENIKQFNYQAKPSSVEIFSSKDLTDSLSYLSKTEKYKNPIQYHTYSSKKPEDLDKSKQSSSSEWIPINAPNGALPAKSYDIPAPDLSRGQAHWLSSAQSDESISEQITDNGESIRNQRQNTVVYGGRKQGEGVVSASVMVKQ